MLPDPERTSNVSSLSGMSSIVTCLLNGDADVRDDGTELLSLLLPLCGAARAFLGAVVSSFHPSFLHFFEFSWRSSSAAFALSVIFVTRLAAFEKMLSCMVQSIFRVNFFELC
jgi:hypothetical protein